MIAYLQFYEGLCFVLYGHVYFVCLLNGEHHGNFWKIRFIRTVHLFSRWKKFPWCSRRSLCWWFIRSCQNPIGFHTTKNWNLWLSHMIWGLWWKCYRIMLRWGIDLKQSYKEGSKKGAWDCVFIIELLVVTKNAKKIKKVL